jgi:hypothetical protein
MNGAYGQVGDSCFPQGCSPSLRYDPKSDLVQTLLDKYAAHLTRKDLTGIIESMASIEGPSGECGQGRNSYDFSQVPIPTDNVDPEQVVRPRP